MYGGYGSVSDGKSSVSAWETAFATSLRSSKAFRSMPASSISAGDSRDSVAIQQNSQSEGSHRMNMRNHEYDDIRYQGDNPIDFSIQTLSI